MRFIRVTDLEIKYQLNNKKKTRITLFKLFYHNIVKYLTDYAYKSLT